MKYRKFSTRLMATAASGVAVMLMAGASFAQQEGQVETVVVTGFRASLENTIALKKNSTQIIEAVSMEDIGKLPDQSIAEAISRLPGLTAQRLNGRSQDISIRGLAPDFSTTLLNGREQVATSNNRSAQYDQYPSELMAGVVVYKTPTADLVGQGLSGTVDMRTVRPLDYDHRILSFNARGETGSLGKLNPDMSMYGFRVSGTYVDQYLGGKLGVTLGIAHMVSPQQFLEYGNWGFTDVSSGVSTSGGAKIQANTDLLTRSSALLTVQYRPDEHWESTIDIFYTKYKDHQGFTRIEFPLVAWGGNSYGTTIGLAAGYTVDDSGLVTAGRYTPGVKAVVRRNADRHNNDLGAYGWKNTYTDGNWTTSLDLNYSSVQRHDQWFETYAGTGRTGDYGGTLATGPTDTLSFKNDSNNVPIFTSSLDYGDYSLIKLTSSQGWGGYGSKTGAGGVTYGEGVHGGQAGYLNYQNVHDYMTSARLNSEVTFDDGIFKKLTFGLYYTNRHKAMTPDEYYVDLAVNAASYTASGTYSDLVIPNKYRTGVSGALAHFGVPKVVTWDSEALLRDGYYTLSSNANADVAIKGWQVDEMTYTGYFKADIDTDVADMPLSGNIGLQVVATHQSSDGYAASNTSGLYGNGVEVRGFTNYVDFLPSLNLSLKPTEESVIRLGAARELVRARMDQMSAANEFSYNESNLIYYTSSSTAPDPNHGLWGGTVGNPKLKPWLADAVDVSYEYYFDKDAYIAVAGFYKYLENYIYQKNELFDFTGYDYTGTATPPIWAGYVTQYVNGNGGNLQGVEVSFALPGHIIDDMLDGFGLTLNASYTDSSIKQNGTSTNVPGLSKAVANITAYYEKDGFSVRLNESYRSRFLGEVTGYAANLETYNIDAQGWLDAQIGYTFQSGNLEGMSVLLQVNNITNQAQVRYNKLTSDPNNTSRVMDWQRYGSTFLFGVTYKM
jgi:iron complex outermembrane recepter protein